MFLKYCCILPAVFPSTTSTQCNELFCIYCSRRGIFGRKVEGYGEKDSPRFWVSKNVCSLGDRKGLRPRQYAWEGSYRDKAELSAPKNRKRLSCLVGVGLWVVREEVLRAQMWPLRQELCSPTALHPLPSKPSNGMGGQSLQMSYAVWGEEWTCGSGPGWSPGGGTQGCVWERREAASARSPVPRIALGE